MRTLVTYWLTKYVHGTESCGPSAGSDIASIAFPQLELTSFGDQQKGGWFVLAHGFTGSIHSSLLILGCCWVRVSCWWEHGEVVDMYREGQGRWGGHLPGDGNTNHTTGLDETSAFPSAFPSWDDQGGSSHQSWNQCHRVSHSLPGISAVSVT